MIRNAFGLLYTSDDNMRLKELTLERTIASVPFGGRYRIIDFAMSNLINSGIISVAVLTQKNYSSLLDHLGSGSAYDLQRKTEGLRLLPPYATTDTGEYRGLIDAFRAARDFLEHTQYKYCIFQNCNAVYNCDYTDMMAQHERTGAEITFRYLDLSEDGPPVGSLGREDTLHFEVDEQNRIVDMELDPVQPKTHTISLGCMLIDKQLLNYLVDEAFSRGLWDFSRDILLRKYKTMRLYAYKHQGYAARMTSVEAYYKANMDLLNPSVRYELFDLENRIYTKVKDEVPSLYKPTALSKNSMLADGCIIEGEIENCILGRGVHVQAGAVCRNSVIQQGSQIQENAQIENCILDKDVIVRRGRRLVGPSNYPIVVRKGSVI